MKITAKQVNPEHQESPLFKEIDEFPDTVIVFGNEKYKKHLIPEYTYIEYFDEMAEEWRNENSGYKFGGGCIRYDKKPSITISELLKNYGFTAPNGRGEWTNKQKHEWSVLMLDESLDRNLHEKEAKVLTLLTGNKWVYTTIRGCSQSEWQEIYYNADEWSEKDLSNFEIEYFNLGSEWEVREEGEDYSWYHYCHCCASEYEEVRKEIAAAAEVTPDEIQLLTFYRNANVYVYRDALTGEIYGSANPASRAYQILLEAFNDKNATIDDYSAAIEEAIGFLGEILDNKG